LSREGSWLAAVLACGAGAVLSHLSAGAPWRIASWRGEQIDVTVPRRGGRKSRQRIRLHRSITLLPNHCRLLNAIPVTGPARTLEDLHRALPAKQFAAALREAAYLGLPVGERLAHDGTRSELERLFLRLCARHRLPPPGVNVRIGRYTADFVWDEPRLVVETDGWRGHRGRLAFAEDHVRDVHLTRRGYQVLRLTYRQVADDPRGVASMLRSLLAP
jgi:very-short-patch-repair endonuclease